MSRNEYSANQQLANSIEANREAVKTVKSAPAGYITGPIIRSENEKPAAKLGDVNDSSTWGIV